MSEEPIHRKRQKETEMLNELCPPVSSLTMSTVNTSEDPVHRKRLEIEGFGMNSDEEEAIESSDEEEAIEISKEVLCSSTGMKMKNSTLCDFSSTLKSSLSDILDADYGLPEKLSPWLSERDYQSLSQSEGLHRMDKLMELINLLPRNEFMEALRETVEDCNENRLPLSESQRIILRNNRYLLAKLIDIDSLLPILNSSNCITEVHYNSLRIEKTSAFERNVCLLTIMLKRSQADYLSFVSALIEIGQTQLASLLSDGGGGVVVGVEIPEPDEKKLVAKFPLLWEMFSHEKRQQFIDLAAPELKLLDIRKGSVAVYLHCKTLSALRCIDQMLKAGKLKSIMGNIFSSILAGRHVEINKLDLIESSYNASLHYFYTTMGFYDKFRICDPRYVSDVMEQRLFSPSINDLPMELLEIVLVKAIVLIFKHLMKLISTGADSLAIAMVFMVCQRWRVVLESRPFNKIQIKGSLDYVCHPFRRRISDGCFKRWALAERADVRGVATLDYELFVVCWNSQTLHVFDLASFTPLGDIKLKGLIRNPFDMAICEVTRRIYIADIKCVWRIDWPSLSSRPSAAVTGDSSLAVEFIHCEGYQPMKLSTSGRRQQLLVTDYTSSLYVYDVDGKLLRRVELPTEVDDDGIHWDLTLHAVHATTGDKYFVCRLGSYRPLVHLTHAEVSEYNSAGQRIRSYYCGPHGDGPQQVGKLIHLSSIDDGRLLVVDRQASRILMLNSELKLERVLLARQQLVVGDDDDSKPLHVCFNSRTGLLCVGMDKVRINFYKIR